MDIDPQMIPLTALPLTIFIVIRRDLTKTLGWTSGPIIAQACHATSAVVHTHTSHPNTVAYFKDLKTMHKITLETKNEESFRKICDSLGERGLLFHEWIEMPEGISTALATIPYRRHDLGDVFKKCQLYK